MERSSKEVPWPESVSYRLTLLQRVLPALPLATVGVVCQVFFRLEGSAPPALVLVTSMWIAMPLLGLLPFPRFGVTLTPSAAVVRNVRRRTIQWSNVQAVQVEQTMGTRRVVLYEAGGRRTPLRVPITGFPAWDSRFEEKFHTIVRWWFDHRGPDWTPVPPRWAIGHNDGPTPDNPFAPPPQTH
ncbi:hypothetical protein [Streptomyces spongiae]|uniref:PH domain-containing protein n=1 Tax=Streptomyces spongiae TaxID=565072 RepID=A0A5N8XJA1_9ACTN|nr:hypothetical protein [Streptomyces spongiae]MPY59543.1 hypothetical protein [Streptomyces spongiae]